MPAVRTALVVGTSRGLRPAGLVFAAKPARRKWPVIATPRGPSGDLNQVTDAYQGRLRVEHPGMTSTEQTQARRARLAGTRLNLLFVKAAVKPKINRLTRSQSTRSQRSW